MEKSLPDNQPPFEITSKILSLVAGISEMVGRLSIQSQANNQLRLRRVNRIRTVQGSLAIEGNTLTQEQITAILDGKRVIAPPRDIQEAHNAIAAYEAMDKWLPKNEKDLLYAHQVLMKGLIEDVGGYRSGGVGVMLGDKVAHMAPPADRVPLLMSNLFHWLKGAEHHPLIISSVFHYEFEFIHPFSDGNGRMGRLWQTLILSEWKSIFANVPVESLVHQHQAEYYRAINESTQLSNSAPFIEFMLQMIFEALTEAERSNATPQDTPQATPQVKALLKVIDGEMMREQIQQCLGLLDRKSFRKRYLLPALELGWLEMTLPDKPKSPLQKYRLTDVGKLVLKRLESEQ